MRSSFSFSNKKDLKQDDAKTNLQSKNLTKSIKKAPKLKSSKPLTCTNIGGSINMDRKSKMSDGLSHQLYTAQKNCSSMMKEK
jgi:hypothetical protein